MRLPDGRKSFKIGLAVLIQYRRVTDTQPASKPPSQPHRRSKYALCISASRSKNRGTSVFCGRLRVYRCTARTYNTSRNAGINVRPTPKSSWLFSTQRAAAATKIRVNNVERLTEIRTSAKRWHCWRVKEANASFCWHTASFWTCTIELQTASWENFHLSVHYMCLALRLTE